jgi:phospholipid transport system substrate-binding protein
MNVSATASLLRRKASGIPGTTAAFLCAIGLAAAQTPATAADPAVQYMVKASRDLLAASRTHSPSAIANVVLRYGDVAYIGLYSLGSYRAKLPAAERSNYFSGMVRFISRYAATKAPEYPVARVEWVNTSMPGASGIMVDSKVVLRDGSTYDVRWLLSKYGNSYRVRDAMVLGFWLTPMLKQLFETYIGENGGNPRALVMALNR